jgi:electron transfer flavoprotein beta subunit
VNIAVCVKQVPDTTAKKELDAEFRLNRASLESVLNPFDEYAIEEAIRQQEKAGGEVTMVTMGPSSADETMRKGLAMGVNGGILVTDEGLTGSDILCTAKTLAAAIKTREFDLILCGSESADARTGLLPAALAEYLGMPLLSYVEKLEVNGSVATAHREIKGGFEVVTASLPVVVMVVKAINEPRYPSLKGIMAAKRKEIARKSINDLGLEPGSVGWDGSKSKVTSATPRLEKAAGQIIAEEPAKAAKLIADYLFENKVIA